jgi:hypothetical protein
MPSHLRTLAAFLLSALLCGWLVAQQTQAQPAATVVPTLVNFSGRAVDAQGKVVVGTAGITFAIYSEQYEGAPLWLETQNVQPDPKGNYTVQLGSTKSGGLPLLLFSSGQARWLGVSVNGETEQPRVLLLSVPYALKAADAQTLGGLPPTAFVLSPTAGAGTSSLNGASSSSIAAASAKQPTKANVSGSGTQNYVPLWIDNNGTLGNSVVYQLGTGATAKIGIGLTNPLATLDVKGNTYVRGTLEPITKGVATASKGYNSNPLDLEASSFSSTTHQAVMQHFEWQAEPTGNNTTTPGGTLNLLYGPNNVTPVELGLSINNNGALTVNSGVTGFSVSSATAGINGQNSIGGYGVLGQATGTTGQGVWGESFGTASANGNGPDGVHGVNHSSMGAGVAGLSLPTGRNTQPGIGVYGQGSPGVAGVGSGLTGTGVTGTSSLGYGVYGSSSSGTGVYGTSGSATAYGVAGVSTVEFGVGVYASSPSGYGVFSGGDPAGYFLGTAETGQGFGPGDGMDVSGGDSENFYGAPGGSFGGGNGNTSFGGGDGIDADSGFPQTTPVNAGFFFGNVEVVGSLSKGGGSFKIDHPLDPANKYLYHSFVESPDMMNIYNGNIVLDGNGEAIVQLPAWFETLNRDFRYQLTSIGGFAPVYIAQKVQNSTFKIAGGKAGMEVSWQVTGIRQDAWANAHRIPVEVDKPESERGLYLYPELYGAPAERDIQSVRHPKMMKRRKEQQAKFVAAGGITSSAKP